MGLPITTTIAGDGSLIFHDNSICITGNGQTLMLVVFACHVLVIFALPSIAGDGSLIFHDNSICITGNGQTLMLVVFVCHVVIIYFVQKILKVLNYSNYS